MKKSIMMVAILVLCCDFVMATNLFAEPTNRKVIEVGTELSHIIYKEPGVMEEKGVMYGINGAYTYHKGYMLKADGRFSYGQVDYKNSGTLNNIDDFIVEVRGVGGYEFSAENSTFTPYIGVGYRYLNDDTSGKTTSTGARGYERESNYFYTPIGIETISSLTNTWLISSMVEYDHFWRGWQKSHLSDVSLGYDDLENTQKKGYGARASLKFLKQGETVDFLIEPFIRYWDIKKSDDKAVTYSGVIVGYGYEPKNTSTEYGIKIAVRF